MRFKNVISNAYESLFPKSALQRQELKTKLQAEHIAQQSMARLNYGYSNGGASYSKNSLKGWTVEEGSPQQDIDLNLNTLRKRSRDVFMNTTIGPAAIKSNRTNCIGEGLTMRSRIDWKTLGIKKEDAINLQREIQLEWKLWSESKKCDIKGAHNFKELQQIAFLSYLLNGDGFAFPLYRDSSEMMPYSLRIRLIEGDKVSTPGQTGDYIDIHRKNKDNGNRIVNGVEIDSFGTVVAYWVCNAYANDLETKKWIRVEAVGKKTGNPNVLHIYEAERCEQYRGVPYLAKVVEAIKQLSRYQEAEIMAAVINGLFAVFIKTEDGGDDVDFGGIDDEIDDTPNNTSENEIKLAPGVINYLKSGESIEIADAKRPNTNFDSFITAMSKYIGAALEIPVEILLMEFSSSYSASRGALLQAWKAFRMRRAWFIDDFCQPIYELLLSEAVSIGRINAPGFFNDPIIRKAYCGAIWNGPAAGQLDPVKEATGANLRISNGLSTREIECTEINGSDFGDNVEQLKTEETEMLEVRKAMGGKKDGN